MHLNERAPERHAMRVPNPGGEISEKGVRTWLGHLPLLLFDRDFPQVPRSATNRQAATAIDRFKANKQSRYAPILAKRRRAVDPVKAAFRNRELSSLA
jgi:hypothetical protein